MKNIFKISKSFLAILLILFLCWQIDLNESFRILFKARFILVLAAFLLFPLGVYLSALKWRLFLKAHRLDFSLYDLVRFYWIGFFVNNFVPSSIGGDIARITLLRHRGGSAVIAASVVCERLSGLLVLLIWAALALCVGWTVIDNGYLYGFLWGGVFLGFLFLGLVYLGSTALVSFGDTSSVPNAPWWSKLRVKVLSFASALTFYRSQKRILLLGVLLSIPFYLTPLLFHFVLFRAIGMPVSLAQVFIVVPLVTLVSLVPVTPNSLGLTEGAFVVLYGQAGISSEEALAVAALARVIALLFSLGGGVFWLKASPSEHKP